jgi:site-specific DNA-cytosine methylase
VLGFGSARCCTGYGGLDLAVELVLGGQLVWFAETDPHARTVLGHRSPELERQRVPGTAHAAAAAMPARSTLESSNQTTVLKIENRRDTHRLNK